MKIKIPSRKYIPWILLGIALLLLAYASQTIRIVLEVALIYAALSIRVIGPQKIGALLIFGRFIREVESGLVIVPFLIGTLVTETSLVIERQYPDEPENVDKSGDDKAGAASGKALPMRITTGAEDDAGGENPLGQRLTVEVSVFSRIKLKKGEFKDFWENIGTVEKMEQQIRDTIESLLRHDFAQKSPAKILEGLGDLSEKLLEEVKGIAKDWGIDVLNVRIVDVDITKTVNESMRDAAAAIFKKKATILGAEAEKKKLVLEGEGKANAEKKLLKAQAAGRQALLEAEAIGTKALAEVAKTDEGKIIAWLQTMKSAMEKAQYSIIPGGAFSEALAGVQAILEKTKIPGGVK